MRTLPVTSGLLAHSIQLLLYSLLLPAVFSCSGGTRTGEVASEELVGDAPGDQVDAQRDLADVADVQSDPAAPALTYCSSDDDCRGYRHTMGYELSSSSREYCVLDKGVCLYGDYPSARSGGTRPREAEGTVNACAWEFDDGDPCTREALQVHGDTETCVSAPDPSLLGGLCSCQADTDCRSGVFEEYFGLCARFRCTANVCRVEAASRVVCPKVTYDACHEYACVPATGRCEYSVRSWPRAWERPQGSSFEPVPCYDGNPCNRDAICVTQGGQDFARCVGRGDLGDADESCRCTGNTDCLRIDVRASVAHGFVPVPPEDDLDEDAAIACNGPLVCNSSARVCVVNHERVPHCAANLGFSPEACLVPQCAPAANGGACTTAPSEPGVPCDDGKETTRDDRCTTVGDADPPDVVCQGTPLGEAHCDDDPCTLDYLDTFGDCVLERDPDRCYPDPASWACYEQGANPPYDPAGMDRDCVVCRKAEADDPYDGWRPVANGTPCEDGDLDTEGDTCGDGLCLSGPEAADACEPGSSGDAACAAADPDWCDAKMSCVVQSSGAGRCREVQPNHLDCSSDVEDSIVEGAELHPDCRVAACQGQQCVFVAARHGQECVDGDPDTLSDTCQDGACRGYRPELWCQDDSGCEDDDADACTGVFRCVSNQCELDESTIPDCVCWGDEASGQVECVNRKVPGPSTPPDGKPLQCHDAVCAVNEANEPACVAEVRPDGTPCDDDDPCAWVDEADPRDRCYDGFCGPADARVDPTVTRRYRCDDLDDDESAACLCRNVGVCQGFNDQPLLDKATCDTTLSPPRYRCAYYTEDGEPRRDGFSEQDEIGLCDRRDNDCDGSTDEDTPYLETDGETLIQDYCRNDDEGNGCSDQHVCGLGLCSGGRLECETPNGPLRCSTETKRRDREYCSRNELGLVEDDDCDGKIDAKDPDDLWLQGCEKASGGVPGKNVCAFANHLAGDCYEGTWIECQDSYYARTAQEFGAGPYETAALTETHCDDWDNDCDGEVDEGFSMTTRDLTKLTGVDKACGTGACLGGTTICTPDGTGILCSTEHLWTVEICDGVDNDCDGKTDASDPVDLLAHDRRDCEKQAGVCSGVSKPVALCVDGEWLSCDAAVYEEHSSRYEEGVELSCDARDNDCDGGTDEDFSVVLLDGATTVSGTNASCGFGRCAGGMTLCTADGLGLRCSTEGNAVDESCNAKDDDCDHLTDAGDPDLLLHDQPPCENQNGVCTGSKKPAGLCVSGLWQPCVTQHYQAHSQAFEDSREVSCDGLDNDCSGTADEDFEVVLADGAHLWGVGLECGKGRCAGGWTECNGAENGIVCSTSGMAKLEVCNGVDDDCNGKSDGGDPGMEIPACEKQAGVCAGAFKPSSLCKNGAWDACRKPQYLDHATLEYGYDYEEPRELTCDGQDNNCDGAIDEGFSWLSPNPGEGDGGWFHSGSPDVHIYYSDDPPDLPTTCGSGECANGKIVCAADKKGITCDTEWKRSDEVCNGRDDDCDGRADVADEADLLLHDARSCENQLGACSGSKKPAKLCQGDDWIPCTPDEYSSQSASYSRTDDICDYIDNNCDGLVDEALYVEGMPDDSRPRGSRQDCGTGLCAGGETYCLDAETLACGSLWKARVELCNAVDDDCDGKTDAADPDVLVYDLRACENHVGVCAGTNKPASRCTGGQWLRCEDATYLALVPTFEAVHESTCDGLDNDCDGSRDEDFSVTLLNGQVVSGVDEGCGTGVCAGGSTVCAGDHARIECSTEHLEGPEACNGLDDDCDGFTDSADPDSLLLHDLQICENQVGVCQGGTKPAELCANGVWTTCDDGVYAAHALGACLIYEPVQEMTCDGFDNDCDGGVDDEFALRLLDDRLVTGVGTPCGTGRCRGGDTVCRPDGLGIDCSTEVAARAERCTGEDDDCDGFTDSADLNDISGDGRFLQDRPACEKRQGVCAGLTKQVFLCEQGAWRTCPDAVYLSWSAAYQAGHETACDGKDNDCDGGADEDFALTLLDGRSVSGVGVPCGTGACSGGVTICNGAHDGIGCSTEVLSTPETCNGFDDDCDGLTDAADPDLLDYDLRSCELQDGVCALSTKPARLCVAGVWQPCDGETYLAYDRLYEATFEASCDGADNDCSGATDENFSLLGEEGTVLSEVGEPCGVGVCAGGRVQCRTDRTGLTCDTYDRIGLERCNRLDDDCDGLTDDADPDLPTDDATLCENQLGVCSGSSKPVALCVVGEWMPCAADEYAAHAVAVGTMPYQVVETRCDTADNDCNGEVDDGAGACSTSIDGGDFWMGCDLRSPGQPDCDPDAGPLHFVHVSPFEADRVEVTVAHYLECVVAGGCNRIVTTDCQPLSRPQSNWDKGPDRLDHPANCVSWERARAYCEWRGPGWRLCTEAEWEMLARGDCGTYTAPDSCDTPRAYPWGSAPATCAQAVLYEDAPGCGAGGTEPVASRPSGLSPLGAYDMAGNVMEWVSDWYDAGYYQDLVDLGDPIVDPPGPVVGSAHVLRGGSYADEAAGLSASKRSIWPAQPSAFVGFRCCRTQ